LNSIDENLKDYSALDVDLKKVSFVKRQIRPKEPLHKSATRVIFE